MTDAPTRVLDTDDARRSARRTRDYHWGLMERAERCGTLWICWWDKDRRHHGKPPRDDLEVMGLSTGMEFLAWTDQHPDWWEIGQWDDAQYAAPVSLTDSGRKALAERHRYDMEPVHGGMVEPGWVCVPAETAA
jgi:hypothetical protein